LTTVGKKMISQYRKEFRVLHILVVWCVAEKMCGSGANQPQSGEDYLLSPGDQILIRTIQAKEVADKQFRIEANGEVNLPLTGRLALSGLTVRQAEAEVTKALGKYYTDPDIAISVAEFHSEAVSIIGAVGNPGVHEAHGRKTLLEMLSLAGGIRPDAGPLVKITRQAEAGPIPLPGAHEATGGTMVAEVDLKSLLAAQNPEDNIYVRRNDVISVPRAEMVYVVGNVKKAGGIPLGGRFNISALEALSMAEGLDLRASPKHARILRPSDQKRDASRLEIPIDLSRILSGKQPDVYLQPNDILFVPNSVAKGITTRGLEAALQIGTGILIWH